MVNNRVCDLFAIKYPIVQAGMVWCSGYKLAAAVSNAGGLGLLGAGSLGIELLEEHIKKCKQATNKPFGVNLPLLFRGIEQQIDIIIRESVPIVFSSAGNPAAHTAKLKEHGIKVVHVVSSLKFALKAQAAGVDAVVAEGFEAGGHNGREETTTLCLLELLKGKLDIPVIAAGGIATGEAMMASMLLGAEGIQVGSRFAVATESSAHQVFKDHVINSQEGATTLTLKEITPVRLMKNEFYQQLETAYGNNASVDELSSILGKGRSKKGILEGDLVEGELEIGQIAASLNKIESSESIINDIIHHFNLSAKRAAGLAF